MKVTTSECVKILDLQVQVPPGELWVSKQQVHIVLEASKSAGAKGDLRLHAPAAPMLTHSLHHMGGTKTLTTIDLLVSLLCSRTMLGTQKKRKKTRGPKT